MGHDVVAIGQHRLNTKSIDALAEDLSERCGVTVTYGYMGDWEDDKIDRQTSFEFVELGRIANDNATLYILYDNYYLERVNAPDNVGERKMYSFCDAKTGEDYTVIYADYFGSSCSFGSRWWRFVEHFKGEFHDDPTWKSYIDTYRRCVLGQVKQYGGSMALYGDDQENSFVYDDEVNTSFEQMRLLVITGYGNACLDVATFQKTYAEGHFEKIQYQAFIE